MMRHWSHLALFAVGGPLLMIVSLKMIQPASPQVLGAAVKYLTPEPNIPRTRVFAALPESFGEVEFAVQAGDARNQILKDYLERHDSPLVDMTDELIAAADAHQLDFRLLVAIARQESSLCKVIPPGGHNCWGWGIHKRGTLGFENYSEAIWTVAKGLREKYLDQGLTTPEEIMSRYTPSSPGTWANGVNQFMEEME